MNLEDKIKKIRSMHEKKDRLFELKLQWDSFLSSNEPLTQGWQDVYEEGLAIKKELYPNTYTDDGEL